MTDPDNRPAELGDRAEPEQVAAFAERVLDEVGRAIVGKREVLALVLAGILAKGHVLLEDFPGLGKTLAARSFAGALGLEFSRAQFTPDLLPADLTGSYVYDQRRAEFDFRPGPIFAGLLLADEINRTPPKTQAALLEAMQEGQVAVERVVVDESVARYCVELVAATRTHGDVLTGASPRGSLGLVLTARAWAAIRGRDYVVPEDVKVVARAVLAHRITVKPDLWMTQASGLRVVDSVLSSVETPRTLESHGGSHR